MKVMNNTFYNSNFFAKHKVKPILKDKLVKNSKNSNNDALVVIRQSDLFKLGTFDTKPVYPEFILFEKGEIYV